MNRDLNTLCYIHEQTSFEEDYNTKFGYTIHKTDDPARWYVIFDAVLQSFGVMNRNRRMYEASNIWHCIKTDDQIQTYLKNNSWMGEMDHPAPLLKGEELTLNRIANPCIGNTSHYIRRPRMNGNLLEGTIQTDSSTDAGMNMAIKIVDGKIVPCFSARVLGFLDTNSGKPIVRVNKLVCYDWVLYASHREAEAKMNQPLQESVEAVENAIGCTIIPFPDLAKMAAGAEDVKFLCESFELTEKDFYGITSTGNSMVYTEGANVYVQPIDANIRQKTKSALLDWIKH